MVPRYTGKVFEKITENPRGGAKVLSTLSLRISGNGCHPAVLAVTSKRFANLLNSLAKSQQKRVLGEEPVVGCVNQDGSGNLDDAETKRADQI